MSNFINKLAKHLGEELFNRQLKLVTVESCTGGGLAYAVTNIPGSSNWFERGFVTYGDLAKEELVGVQPSTLEYFGAVSEQSVREMAEGALKNSQSDISIAITGIAGPGGGTPEKPIGMVWLAWTATHKPTATKMVRLSGDRIQIREQTIQLAIEILIEFIQDNFPIPNEV